MAFDPDAYLAEQIDGGGFNPDSYLAEMGVSVAKPKKKISERLAESKALPMAGGVIGGLAGGIPGAALGGAAGESYRQLLARKLGLEAPKSSMEAAKGIATESATQAISEGVGTKVLAPIARGVGRVAKKPAGQLLEIITKIKPQNAKAVFENPKAILPGQFDKAREAWKSVARKAGLPVDETSPELINALKTDAKKTVFETFEKIQRGEMVDPRDIQIAKQAMDISLMPAAKTERNKPLIALYSQMRDVLSDKLGEQVPELVPVNKQYAVTRAGKRFQSLFPQNLDESPAYFRSTIPSLLLGLNASQDDSRIEGLLKSAAIATAASPLTLGTGIAALGAAKGAGPAIGRAGVSAATEAILERIFGGRKDER